MQEKRKQNKTTLNAYVSEGLKKAVDEFGLSPDYGSASNFVESGLQFYLGALYKENEIKIKQLETEMSQLKNEYDEKIKQLETEQKQDKDIIFAILTNHPELIPEYNEIKEKCTQRKETIRYIKF